MSLFQWTEAAICLASAATVWGVAGRTVRTSLFGRALRRASRTTGSVGDASTSGESSPKFYRSTSRARLQQLSGFLSKCEDRVAHAEKEIVRLQGEVALERSIRIKAETVTRPKPHTAMLHWRESGSVSRIHRFAIGSSGDTFASFDVYLDGMPAPRRAHVHYRPRMGLIDFAFDGNGPVPCTVSEDEVNVWQSLDLPGPVQFKLRLDAS
jgi:hypothetical protein